MSVVWRVAKSGTVEWLTRRFEGPRPKCKRWDCETCHGDDCEVSASSKPYLVIQTQTEGASGWEDWYFTKLEAEVLSVVQQWLPRIARRGPFGDCAAAS
jgi:hypothetical protein